MEKKKIITLIILVTSIIILILYMIFNHVSMHQPINNEEEYIDEIIEYHNDVDPKLIELKDLYNKNKDLYGWIKIENSVINYPVMYTKGEDYYLYKDFYKKYYKAGSLFVDKNNNVTPRDINLIIHGHNMKNGTMFGYLPRYKKEDYYKEHSKITFYTLDTKEEYEIISVFVSKIYNTYDEDYRYYKFYNTENEEEYNEFIDYIKENSLYDIDKTAKYPDKLITLSTCDYTEDNGRLVVVGRKVN